MVEVGGLGLTIARIVNLPRRVAGCNEDKDDHSVEKMQHIVVATKMRRKYKINLFLQRHSLDHFCRSLGAQSSAQPWHIKPSKTSQATSLYTGRMVVTINLFDEIGRWLASEIVRVGSSFLGGNIA